MHVITSFIMTTLMVDKRKKILEGSVIKVGNSGGVLVPKEWIGKIAKVQIIEEAVKDE